MCFRRPAANPVIRGGWWVVGHGRDSFVWLSATAHKRLISSKVGRKKNDFETKVTVHQTMAARSLELAMSPSLIVCVMRRPPHIPNQTRSHVIPAARAWAGPILPYPGGLGGGGVPCLVQNTTRKVRCRERACGCICPPSRSWPRCATACLRVATSSTATPPSPPTPGQFDPLPFDNLDLGYGFWEKRLREVLYSQGSVLAKSSFTVSFPTPPHSGSRS